MSPQLRAVHDLLELHGTKITAAHTEKIVKWLYRYLDTLDSKMGHLLGYNSLILAAQTFLVGFALDHVGTPALANVLLGLLFVPLLSAFIALPVFRVQWLFFGTQSAPAIIERELVKLAVVCDKRHVAHQLAWGCSLVSGPAFVATVLIVLIDYASA